MNKFVQGLCIVCAGVVQGTKPTNLKGCAVCAGLSRVRMCEQLNFLKHITLVCVRAYTLHTLHRQRISYVLALHRLCTHPAHTLHTLLFLYF
jgi:hypothetical protein